MHRQTSSLSDWAGRAVAANAAGKTLRRDSGAEHDSHRVTETGQVSDLRDCVQIIESCKRGDQLVPAGTTLFFEGEASRKLYILLDGWVTSSRSVEDGRQLILNFLMPGAFLGFQSNLLAPLDTTVRCLTDALVCVFPTNRFITLLEKNPALALFLNNRKAEDDKAITDNLINIASRPARARVAYLLLDLHKRILLNQPASSHAGIHLPLTRQDIADTLGLTNVHVSRAISALQKEKLLSFRKSRLQIHDFETLTNIATGAHD